MLTIKPEIGFVETVEVLDEVRDIRVPAPSNTPLLSYLLKNLADLQQITQTFPNLVAYPIHNC